MGAKQNNLYREAVRKAIDNSIELFKESNLLYDNNHYPRGFLLCVLSLEEFSKAFMYRCVSVGILTEQGVQKIIGDHPLKIQTSAHLIRWAIYLLDHLQDIMKAIEDDKQHQDHSKHKFPKITDKSAIESTMQSIETLHGGFNTQNLSRYVEIKEGKIIIPDDVIDKERCEKAINNTQKVLKAHTNLLLEKDEFFTECVNDYLYLLIRDIQAEINKRLKEQ